MENTPYLCQVNSKKDIQDKHRRSFSEPTEILWMKYPNSLVVNEMPYLIAACLQIISPSLSKLFLWIPTALFKLIF